MRTFRTLAVLLLALALLATPASAKIDRELYDALDSFARELETSRAVAGDASGTADRARVASVEGMRSLKAVQAHVAKAQNPDDVRLFFSTVNVFLQTKRGAPYTMAAMRASALLEEKSKFIAANAGDPGELEFIKGEVTKLRSASVAASAAPVAEFAKAGAKPPAAKGALPAALLGAHATATKTTFSVYSPRATAVNLILYKAKADPQGKAYPMKKGDDGIWRMAFDANLAGTWYKFQADGPKGNGERFDPKNLLSDPCAFANAGSAGKSLVVADNYAWKTPSFRRPAMKDLVIYEMHVKDYTQDPSSGVPAAHRGKYLGLLHGQKADVVLGNLLELGVNAVELLPVQEFDNRAAPSGVNHWGYMTTHFFAPESSFASGDEGQQVTEFKKLVDGLHAAGIAVILDVVYNHTAEGNEQGPAYNFKGFDNPAYYRLYTNPENYWNGTGCGNEFRSDHPATRKYILDSLKYWVKEYKVDGFRFDLATILDKETMMAINDEMPAGVYLIAEPWAADWARNQWTKGDFRGTRWAKWNDDYKNHIKKFIRGEADRNSVMTVVTGSCFWWAGKPTESINFIECHDNATIMDFLGGWQKGALFGAAVLLTSQGVPMLHEGQEFLKTKFGNDNSYDQDNKVNWIDWSLKAKNRAAFDFISGLVKLRMKYPHFRKDKPLDNGDITWILHANQKALGFKLHGTPDLVVLYNSDPKEWAEFNLPDGCEWTKLCDGEKVNLAGMGTAKGTYGVPPTSVVVLRK